MIKQLFLFVFLLFAHFIHAQNGIIKGIIKNQDRESIEGVAVSYLNNGTVSNKNGEYSLTVPTEIEIAVLFSHVSYKTLQKNIIIPKNKTYRYYPILIAKVEEIDEVIVKDYKRDAQGTIKINPADVIKIPGANQGIENILMTLPGINNNNELSTQYNVRGGNFDENLVYVNGIEVYRPFLVRSGQQEGLSFVNPHLVQDIPYSA